MGSRRKAREVALQLLYLHEFNPEQVEEALNHFWRPGELDAKVVAFTRQLVWGTVERKEELDRFIGESSDHWRLDRMALVDRNIMRMAVYEFLFIPDTPKKVVINEAIEIAKRFSSGESTQFINGVLDNIRKIIENKEQ
jgi:N utilization substance protein B